MVIANILRKTALFILLTWLCIQVAAGQTSPEKVEPPFWWAGMQQSELQILVYGDKIAHSRVIIEHPGVQIKEVVSVESPNYLFIYLELENAAPESSFDIEFRQGDKTVYQYSYHLRKRKEDAREIQGFDASDAIYLLMPDRFANGNPALDNLPQMLEKVNRENPDARQGGDIQGIVDNLDHIADMGFTAIWINPLLENNQPRYSYHGYAITDFYKIDPRFGTNQDFVNLIDSAGERGVRIIKDMVLNHCGHYHWWMNDLPSADWIHHWPEFTRTAYPMTTLVDPHFANSDFIRMNHGWFDTNMPDLNHNNRLLADYLIQNSIWWIEYSGIGGIRMDTQPFVDKEFMARWAFEILKEFPQFNIVGEQWHVLPPFSAYFQGGKEQYDGYNSHIPTVFDFPLFDALAKAFTEQQGWDSGMTHIYNVIAQDFLYADHHHLIVFGDNHDTDRIFTRLGDNIDNLKLALAFLTTTRGIPQFYSGFETLESAYEHDGHGIMRVPFPGGWPDDSVNAFTREGRTEDQNKVVDYLSQLLNYRKSKPVLHYGKLKHFVPENNVYVYFRYNEDETVMVVINNNKTEEKLSLARFEEITGAYTRANNVLNGEVLSLDREWLLPAKSALVLELR